MNARPVAALFLLALFAYFAAQAGLRVALGGAFEWDEAEMVVLARDWHLAFGSQPPLYNWYQTAFFDAFGVGTLGLMLAKNAMLFAAYAVTFLALRREAGSREAMVGALALALIPNLAWWAQRTGSHSIALVAMTAVTLAAFLHLLRRPGTGAFLLFGLAMGLGGLAKPNYWLVPPALILAGLTMAEARAVLWRRRLLLSLAVALAVVAVPYALMLAEPLTTFSDTWEFQKGAEPAERAVWAKGLARMAEGGLAELVPLALAAGLVLGLGRRKGADWGLRRHEALMLRAALIGVALMALGVVLTGTAFVRARWMLPLFMLAAPPVMIWAMRQAGDRAFRNYLRAMLALAALLLANIADTRLRGAGSDSLRLDVLAERIEDEVGEVPPILGPHYYTGNLLLHRPSWQVFPPFPTQRLATPRGRILVIDEKAGAEALMREQGFAGEMPAPVLSAEAVLPYRFTEGETRTVRFHLFDFGPAAQ